MLRNNTQGKLVNFMVRRKNRLNNLVFKEVNSIKEKARFLQQKTSINGSPRSSYSFSGRNKRKAQGLVEYALLVGLLATVALLAITHLGEAINQGFLQNIRANLEAASVTVTSS
ncbi:MAG: hypothetical protein HQM08_13095 [Candidatus Riflebacteria bacterium]|nr:hypothetical protein [Candidatus Riflebacteria bacterium]